MKSWGVFIVTAMGFLVGMVLAGVGGLSAKTAFFSSPVTQQPKKIETYWAESGLTQKELFDLISNANCQSSEKYFLACVNSVLQSGEDLLQTLSSESGLLQDVLPSDQALSQPEKENLKPFMVMYAQQKNHLINFEKIWLSLLRQEKNEKQGALIATGINGFLSIYKDPHTYILPNNYYEEVGSQIERSNTFIGVSFEKIKNEIRVRKVFKNSDADHAGLKNQDVLISLDKQLATESSLQSLSQILRNTEPTQFVFKIKRQGIEKEIIVKRSYQKLNHVQFDILPGARAYALLTITKFSRGVCVEVSKKIRSASDKNITGLVLDLRDNPGGQLDEAACLAGLFIGINKKIYSVEYFNPVKADEVVLTTGSLLYTGPMTILVNSSSASASELFAGALKEYKRALVIGEKTFGKGTFQESETWSKNSQITLFKTQGFYLLPSRFSTQLVGVTPHIEVSEPHLQQREENLYLNPIAHQATAVAKPQANGNFYDENLKKCAHLRRDFPNDDAILKKAVDVLSCRALTITLATQFNIEEFKN